MKKLFFFLIWFFTQPYLQSQTSNSEFERNVKQTVYIGQETQGVLINHKIQVVDVPGTGVGFYNGEVEIDPIYQQSSNVFVLKDNQRNIQVFDDPTGQKIEHEITNTSNHFDSDFNAVDTYWSLQKTYDYFLDTFGRYGFANDLTTPVKAFVNRPCTGSFWDGYAILICSAENNDDRGPASSLDLVAHEYMHGIIKYTADFNLTDESAALSEAFPDMIGVIVEQLYYPSDNNWIIGELYVTEDGKSGLRNLAYPADPNMTTIMAAHYDDFDPTKSEYYNSGIASHWFYLLAGGSGGIQGGEDLIQGIPLADAAKIVYHSLTYMFPDSRFIDARIATIKAAETLFGFNSYEAQQVAAAWHDVGVGGSYGAFVSSCRERDSLALLELYNTNGGTSNFQWNINQPFDTWAGVTTNTEGCVIELSLALSGIDSLPPGINVLPPQIGNLNDLMYFFAEDNNIETLPSEIGKLESLIALDLSGNQIYHLPVSIANLDNLMYLYLEDNLFSELQPQIGGMSSLEVLAIDRNNISSLHADIGDLTNLVELNASGNNISSISNAIYDLPNLYLLNLRNNKINTLSSDIGNLSNIQSIDLGENSIEQLPEQIWNLTGLADLYLDNNQIADLPTSVENLSNLYTLDLSNNQLQNLPSQIWTLGNLYSLNLEKNQLTTLSNQIGNLNYLIELKVGYNALDSLPEEIWTLSDLGFLHIEDCGLTMLPEAYQNLTFLTELYLTDNDLTSLPGELKDSEYLIHLDVRGNKLIFSRELKELAQDSTLIDFFHYAQQDSIPLYRQGNVLYVNANDTKANENTFTWYKDEEVIATIYDDNTYVPIESGNYYCEVTNNIITQSAEFRDLTLTTSRNFYFDPTSLPVRPGDYDLNGIVNHYDLIQWGLAYGNQGPCRYSSCAIDTSWTDQYCDDWNNEVRNINGKHQDGDGDGEVTDLDKNVILINYDSVRPVFINNKIANPDIQDEYIIKYELASKIIESIGGDKQRTLKYNIIVERRDPTDTRPVSLHALVFTLQYQANDPPLEFYADADSSSMGEVDSIGFIQVFNPQKKSLDIAISLKNTNNKIIDGATLEVVIVDQIIQGGDDPELLTVDDGSLIQADETSYALGGQVIYHSATFDGAELTINPIIGLIQPTCTFPSEVEALVEDPAAYTYDWDTGDTTHIVTGLPPGIYTLELTRLEDNVKGFLTFQIPEPLGCPTVTARVLLEGACDTIQSMTDALRGGGFVPLTDPYTATYTTTPAVLNITGENAIVDWVQLQFRADPVNIITSRSALLQRDGDIVDVDGISPVRMVSGFADSVYLVVNHRIHLPAMSPVPMGIDAINIDFTTNDSYNTGGAGQKQLPDGRWAMFVGDANNDNDINGEDKIPWGNANGTFNIYSQADFNLNKDINGTDKALWSNNQGRYSAVR